MRRSHALKATGTVLEVLIWIPQGRPPCAAFSRYPSHKRKAGRGVCESRCIGKEGAGASVEDLICSSLIIGISGPMNKE